MALFVLALLVVAVVIFLGAAVSSRARSEKKSIASFHQHMDQLSGVVKSENHPEDGGSETGSDLFTSLPSHVRVVGKATGAKGSSSSKRRAYRTGSVAAATARRGRPSAKSPNLSERQSNEIQVPQFQADLHSIDVAPKVEKPTVPVEESARMQRRTRLSSSTRPGGSKVHSEVLRFDDAAQEGAEEQPSARLFGFDRRFNPKILAAASVIALVGLGAVFVALNSSHPNVSGKGSVSIATTKPVGKSKSTTATTEAPSAPAGPLAPTTADSAGATYFVNSPSITIGISASAPAWVEESVAPGSKVLWQGIIPADGSKSFTLNSSMWIRTGNVGVLTITANGQPVTFSAAPGVYDFTFRQGVKA